MFDSLIFTHAEYRDPYPAYAALLKRTPVAWSERMRSWAVLTHEAVTEAGRLGSIGQGDRTLAYVEKMSAADQAALHPLCPYMSRFISFLDPPEHKQQRELIGRVFRPKTIAALGPPIQAEIDGVLDRLAGERTIDALEDFALPLTSSTICRMVGVPLELRARFIAEVLTIFSFLGSDHTDPKLARLAKNAYTWITSELLSRIRQPGEGDDLAAQVGRLVRQGAVSEGDGCGMLVGLVQGGFETTTSLISSTIFSLLRHPDQLALLRRDPGLLPGAVVESLRFESPLKYVTRQAYADVTVGGQAMHAGDQMMLMLGAANRDARVFGEPDLFDIRRDAKDQVAFGLGIHFCLGAALARLQAELAVWALVSRFDSLELVEPPEAYQWKESALLRQLESLQVRV